MTASMSRPASPSISPSAAGSHRWWRGLRATAALALSIVAALAARTKLNGALADMHPPGQGWGDYASVSGPSALWSPGVAVQTMTGWRAWETAEIGVAHGVRVLPVLAASAAVDLMLLAIPVALLIYIAASATAERYPVAAGAHADLGAIAKAARRVVWPMLIIAAVTLRSGLLVTASQVDSGAASIIVRIGGALTGIAYIAVVVPAFLIVYVNLAGELGLRERLTDPNAASHSLRRIGRVIIALRMQAIAAAVFPLVFVALGSGLTEQVDDLALRWPSTPWTLVATVVAALLLSVLLLVTGYLCWRWYDSRTAGVRRPTSGWIPLVTGLVLLAGYIVSFTQPAPWGVLLWPALVFLGIGLVSVIEKPRADSAFPIDLKVNDTHRAHQAAHVLAGVPLAMLGFIAIRAGVEVLILRATLVSAGTAYVVGAVAILALAWLVVTAPPPATDRVPLTPIATGCGMVFGTVGVLCAVDPIRFGPAFGAMAVMYAFSGVLLATLVALVRATTGRSPSAPIAALRTHRVPVLAFLGLWLVVTSAVQGTDHFHDARLITGTTPAPQPITAAEAVSQWLAASGPSAPSPGARSRSPMVFVATFGGGGRAAYWTNLVLDCLFEPRAEPVDVAGACDGPALDEASVFAESGVSGGALGLAVHRALGSKPFAPALSNDFVSPDIAAMVFRDAEAFWIPAPLKAGGHDRAAVLEEAWESATNGALTQGLYASAWRSPSQLRFPVMVFNSATVDDGCRLNVSVLRAATADPTTDNSGCATLAPFAPSQNADVGSVEPGVIASGDPVFASTKDVYDYLCSARDNSHISARHDISLSTAALLSARFPYVSPTGGLTRCSSPQRRTFAMDGGVLDSSGTSTLAELWSSIAGQVADYDNNPLQPSCVEPRLLMIDNGYADPGPVSVPAQPQELTAPLDGALAARDQQTARDEQATALAFEHAFGSIVCRGATAVPAQSVATRVALVAPSARPGPYAPVGWSLSTYATDDLAEQLHSAPNQCELAVVHSWYEPADVFAPGGPCFGLQLTSPAGPVTFR